MSTEEVAVNENKESAWKRILKQSIKIIITIVCFWYISTKIDFTKALNALTRANALYLFIALLFFILSKLFSAFRLNINFRNINIHISEWKNIKLYWLGMYYNLFLP